MYIQLYFGTFVLASTVTVEMMHKKQTSFKILASMKAIIWQLKVKIN